MNRWLLLLLIATFPSTLRAERVGLGSLPRKARAVGFNVQVSVEGAPNFGYQPVYLDVVPLGGTFRSTRHLKAILSPRGVSETEFDFDQHHSFQLPQGASSFTTTAYVPYHFPWHQLTVRLFEDGEFIDTGEVTFTTQQLRLQAPNGVRTMGIIWPRDGGPATDPWKQFPDVRTLTTVLGGGPLPEDVDVARLDHRSALQRATAVQPATVQYRPMEEDELHTTWLGYSQLDIILVPAPLLQRIAREQPEARRAIDDWVAAGGNLWVYAADGMTGEFVPTRSLVSAPPIAAVMPRRLEQTLSLAGDNDTSGWVVDPWSGSYRQSANYRWNSSGTTQLKSRDEVFRDLQKANHPFVTKPQASELQAVVRHGAIGLGTVTTIADEDPFPGSFVMWESIHRLHGDERLQWTSRNGIRVPDGDTKYWSSLIESVGQPPVKSFILLNTLFVLTIGPLCYFFFRRRERLYLLFFVAPAVAVLVTASLFLYALAADGIRTRAQVTMLTWVDPHNEYTCSQTHHTYYATLSRRGGLRFEHDAMVSPVRGVPLSVDYRRSNPSHLSSRQIVFTDDAQRFRGAFLPTRDQVQYLSLVPKRDDRHFAVDFDSSPESPTVDNPFSFAVHRLLVRDGQQRYWIAESIEAGGRATLQATDFKSARIFLQSPLLDPLFAPRSVEVPSLGNWSRGYRNYMGNSLGTRHSWIEQRLIEWNGGGLPPNSFLAFAETPEGTVAADSAIVVEDSHVLMGGLR